MKYIIHFFNILAIISWVAAFIIREFGYSFIKDGFIKDGSLLVKCFIGCIITCIVSLGFGIFLSKHEKVATTIEHTQTQYSYNIMNEQDISFGDAKRYQLSVVVYGQPTADELKDICNIIAEDYKKTNDYNALVIFLCDNKYYCKNPNDGLPTLGKAEYAPEGDWSKASEVLTGDYSNFAMNYDIKDKDWGKQPTEEEVKLYYKLKIAFKEARKLNPDGVLDEDKIRSEVAKANNTTPEKVESNFLKIMAWSM